MTRLRTFWGVQRRWRADGSVTLGAIQGGHEGVRMALGGTGTTIVGGVGLQWFKGGALDVMRSELLIYWCFC